MEFDFLSDKSLEAFWSNYAKSKIIWTKSFDKAICKSNENLNKNFEYKPNFKWFNNGIINLKKTLFSNKSATSIAISYFANNTCLNITYSNFLNSCSFYIKSILKKDINDRIMIIGSASPETMTMITSSALCGKCHCVLFEDLSVEAIICRVKLFEPSIIYIRDTLDIEKLTKIKELINKEYINVSIELFGDFYQSKNWQEKEFENKICDNLSSYKEIPEVRIKSNDLIFCLFTSGSTGTPKGIWHSYGGYLIYTLYTFEEFFLKAGAKNGIFCATDAAWINGHTYAIYGPLLTGTRTIFIKDLNDLQKPDELSKFIYETKPSFFYSSVTLLRAIRSIANITETKYASDSRNQLIYGIGSCGEPLANEVAKWALKFFETKNEYIVNTYFQTETGGVIVAPRFSDGKIKDYSTVGKPKFPLSIILNKKDNSLEISVPWPGCFAKVTSDRKPNYWSSLNKYLLQDNGFYDEEKFLYVGGRTDDVMNVSGHRVSSAEIESTILKFDKKLKESAAVSVSDPIIGSKIVIFLVSSSAEKIDKNGIKKFLVKNLSPYHKPWKIFEISCLPKTKSGKIARRILRNSLQSDITDKKNDFSTIINYEEFKLAFQKLEYGKKN